MENLFEEIENDLAITHETLSDKIYTVPALHSKYLRIYFREKSRLAKMEAELNKIYRERYEFYTFKYDKKLENQKEIQFHILSDDLYSDQNRKVDTQKALVDCIDRTLKKVNQLTFDVKNILETLKYLNGV